MKRFVGAIFCLLTVFLLGSGFLFGSFSALSFKKWNTDLTKINPEEELFETDSDTDDDSCDLINYQVGFKKCDKKLLAEHLFPKIYIAYKSKVALVHFTPHLREKSIDALPVWLKVRHILI